MEFPYGEGATPLDPDESQDLLPTHISTIAELNEWEQANILEAEGWLFGRKQSALLTEKRVRELHLRMFDKTWRWAGKYRSTAKNFGVSAHQIPMAVRDTCQNAAFQLANRTLPIDELAVRLHHRMVSIHPFPNGNGRHTRLLADAVLFHNGHDRFSWGRANLQIRGEARDRYIDALQAADNGDYHPLLSFARS